MIKIFVTLCIGFIVGYWWRGRPRGKVSPIHGSENLEHANVQRREARDQALKRIMELFEEQAEVTNDDVEKLLSVSDATATNYLQELETVGSIHQVGEQGRSVSYKKNG